MDSANALDQLSARVLAALRSGGHAEAAMDLQGWLAKFGAPAAAERDRARDEIRQRCSSRWLGDLNVAGEPDWLGLLDDLRTTVDGGTPLPRAPKPAAAPSPPKPPPKALAPIVRGDSAGTLVERLDRWIAANRPKFHAALKPGAGLEEIARFEREVGSEMPLAWREFYAWRNGSRSADESFQYNWELMSLDGSLGEREFMLQNRTSQPDWTEHWIPFLSSGGGDFVVVDLGGSFGGRPGQIVEFGSRRLERVLLHANFRNWLETFVRTLEEGLWKLKAEGEFGPVKKSTFAAAAKKFNPGFPVLKEGSSGRAPLFDDPEDGRNKQ